MDLQVIIITVEGTIMANKGSIKLAQCKVLRTNCPSGTKTCTCGTYIFKKIVHKDFLI